MSLEKVYQYGRGLPSRLFPPICILCGASAGGGIDLCQACLGDLTLNHPCCRCCAHPLPTSAPRHALCGACQNRPPAFDRVLTPFRYEGGVIPLITGLKFHGKMNHARLLGQLLCDFLQPVIATRRPERLIAVPLHRQRQTERGFNQALELIRDCARRHGLPLDHRSMARVVATDAQSQLNAKQRRSNVRGAFQLTRKIQSEYVVLIDDVVTTGSTVNELAKILKAAGVRRVDVWAIARTG